MRDFKDVEGNASLITPPCPLRIESSCLLVLVYIDCFVQRIDLVLLPPVFRVLELTKGILWDKLSCAKVSEKGFVVMGGRSPVVAGRVVAFGLAERLELVESGGLVVGEVVDVTGGPLSERSDQH